MDQFAGIAMRSARSPRDSQERRHSPDRPASAQSHLDASLLTRLSLFGDRRARAEIEH
jgi:hypothetical protein